MNDTRNKHVNSRPQSRPPSSIKRINKTRQWIMLLFFSFLVMWTFTSFSQNFELASDGARIGGEFTKDGTMFLIYVPDQNGAGNVRETIPYDTNTLRADVFRLFIILRNPNDRINVTVSVYHYKIDTPIENLTLKYQLTQEVYNGLNAAGNPFYADVEFSLQLANTTELVAVQIKERLITFYHKTSEFEVPITMTTGEYIFQLGIAVLVALVVFLLSGFAGMGLYKRTGYVPFFPGWMLLLLFSVMELGFLISIMLDIQFDIELLILSAWKNLVFMLLLPAFILGAFFWGNIVSRNSGNIKDVLFLGLVVRNATVYQVAMTETVLFWRNKLYRLHIDEGLDSIRHFLLALLGKREEFKNYHSITLPPLPEARQDFDEIIWLEDLEIREGKLLNFQKLGVYNLIPLGVGVAFLILGSIITIFIGSGIITSTLFSLAFLLLFVGILVFVLDVKHDARNTEFVLTPLKDPELVELFALRKDPIKQLKRDNMRLKIALTASTTTDDLEKIVNLQAAISGQDPDEVLQHVTALEDTLKEMDIPPEDVEYIRSSIMLPDWEDIDVASLSEGVEDEEPFVEDIRPTRKARATSKSVSRKRR